MALRELNNRTRHEALPHFIVFDTVLLKVTSFWTELIWTGVKETWDLAHLLYVATKPRRCRRSRISRLRDTSHLHSAVPLYDPRRFHNDCSVTRRTACPTSFRARRWSCRRHEAVHNWRRRRSVTRTARLSAAGPRDAAVNRPSIYSPPRT